MMNTIFLKLVKKAMTQTLDETILQSKEADASFENVMLRSMGQIISTFSSSIRLGRDPDRAESKRDKVEELKVQISQWEDCSDEKINSDLIKRIGEMRHEIFKINGDSDTTIALMKLESFLRALYDKFASLGEEILINGEKKIKSYFLGIPYNDDPLTKFRYAAALYLSDKVREHVLPKNSKGITDYIVGFVTSINIAPKDLAPEKERFLIEILQECITRINILEQSPAVTAEIKKAEVLEKIHAVIEKNKAICMENSNVFIRYKVGSLDICMHQAIEKIAKNQSYDIKKSSEEEERSASNSSGMHEQLEQVAARGSKMQDSAECGDAKTPKPEISEGAVSRSSKMHETLELAAACESKTQENETAKVPEKIASPLPNEFGFGNAVTLFSPVKAKTTTQVLKEVLCVKP